MKNLYILLGAFVLLTTIGGAEASFNITATDNYTGNPINNFEALFEYSFPWFDITSSATFSVGGRNVNALYYYNDSTIYAIVGNTTGNAAFTRYNPLNNTWFATSALSPSSAEGSITGSNSSTLYFTTNDVFRYTVATNTFSNIVHPVSGGAKYASAFNSTAVYFGTTSGRIHVYNPVTTVWTDLSATDPGNWMGTSNVRSIQAYNSTHVYLALNDGKMGFYNPLTNTTVDLSSTDPGDWVGTSNVRSIYAHNSTAVYTGLDSGKFGVYNPVTNVWTDLSATDPGNWVGTNIIRYIHIQKELVYTGLTSGLFGVYNPVTNVWTDLSATDSGNWVGTSQVQAITGFNNTLYTGISGGKLGFYELPNNLSTSTGVIYTGFVVNSSQTSKVTVFSTNYFSASYTNVNSSSLSASLFQHEVGFTATEIISGLPVDGEFTVCAPLQCATGTNLVLYLAAGTYNLTFNKTGWYNLTFEYTAAPLTSTTHNIDNTFRYQLNFTLRNAVTNAVVNNYSATFTSGNYSFVTTENTTNGSIIIPWVEDNNLNVTIFNSIVANKSQLFNVSGSTPIIVGLNMTSFLQNTVQFIIKNAQTQALVAVATNITLTGNTTSYSLSTSNGTLLQQSLNQDTYFVNIQATGFPAVQALLTTAGDYQTVTYYVDSSSQSTTFSVLDTFNNPVTPATVTFYQNFNGTYQTISQVITDISGTFNINLNPSVRYLVTSVATGYDAFSGEIQPSQPQTYIIRMRPPSEVQGSNVLGSLFFSTQFLYNTSNPVQIDFVYEVNSLIGDLDYFWANTTYLGTPYFTNVSGIPGGGIITFNITGVNITQQNQFNVTIAFKRTGFQEYSVVVPFFIEFYTPNTYSAYTGLFNLPVGVGGRAIIGTILLLFIVAGIWSITSSSEATLIAGVGATGLFSIPVIGLFPLAFGIITVSVIVIILIGDAVVNR